jgi:membrane protein YqaA with SNARE-associated domain
VTVESIASDYGAYIGTFLVAAIAGFLPIVMVDALLVYLAVRSDANLVAVVVIATAATVIAKVPLFFALRRVNLEKLRAWMEKKRAKPIVVLAVSSLIGVPPFTVVTAAAPALGIPFRPFLIIITVGRLIRYSIVVAIAVLV